MKISGILRHKGSAVTTIGVAELVTDVLAALADQGIGALVVLDGARVVGIVSERDIVRRLDQVGGVALSETVQTLMSSAVVSCRPDDSVDDIASVMTERRIRHMPVLEDGHLVGIISIGDVVLSRIRQLEDDRGQLEHYITG